MKYELKLLLFNTLKLNFESATDFADYSHWNVEFEIDEDYSDEETLICDVTITADGEETIIRLSIDEERKTMINSYEDAWDKWNDYDWTVSNLWRMIFFNKTILP